MLSSINSTGSVATWANEATRAGLNPSDAVTTGAPLCARDSGTILAGKTKWVPVGPTYRIPSSFTVWLEPASWDRLTVAWLDGKLLVRNSDKGDFRYTKNDVLAHLWVDPRVLDSEEPRAGAKKNSTPIVPPSGIEAGTWRRR